jgi:hypothetical protein
LALITTGGRMRPAQRKGKGESRKNNKIRSREKERKMFFRVLESINT